MKNSTGGREMNTTGKSVFHSSHTRGYGGFEYVENGRKLVTC